MQPERHHPGLGGGVDELSAIRGQRESKGVLGPCAGIEAARSDPRALKWLSWGNRRRWPFAPVTNGGNGKHDDSQRGDGGERSVLYTKPPD